MTYLNSNMNVLMEDPSVVFTIMIATLIVVLLASILSIECLFAKRQELNDNQVFETTDTSPVYEEDSEDDATSVESDYSATSEDEEDSPTEQYTSVLFKSFSLLTKKQLLKMTGRKYRNKNKDELVVIAMSKFISKAVEHSERLPKGIKLFVKENKQIMRQELIELYKVNSVTTDEGEVN